MGEEDARSFGKFDLRDLGVLGPAPDEDFQIAVRLAARAVRAPVSTFSVLDFEAGLSRLRAHVGLETSSPEVDEIPIEASLALSALTETDLVVLPDVAADPLAATHPFLRANGIRSILAAPVLCPAREVVALLAVHDRVPRIWTQEDRETIRGLAKVCTGTILLRAALRTIGLVSRGAFRRAPIG